MEAVRQRLRVGVVLLVELHAVPSVFAPVLPVLHEHAHRHPLAPETVGGAKNLIGTVETLATVDVAQGPGGHQRALAGEVAVGGYHLVGLPGKHGVVHRRGDGGAEHRLAAHLVVEEHRLVAAGEFRRQLVPSGLQVYDAGGGGGQPHVLHVHHRLPVDVQVVAACHLLPHVEQQRVVAAFGDVDDTLEDVVLAHLALAALRGGDVHFLTCSRSGTFRQFHAL